MSESTDLTLDDTPIAALTNSLPPHKIAEAIYKSRYFGDTLTMSQAVVKVLAGEELGLSPFAAVQGITIIEGKLGMTSNLMATLVQQSKTHRYKVVESTNERCSLEFYEYRQDGDDELLGVSDFTVADAEQAGLVKEKSNWEKWPKAMCFSRALTQGVRTYCPIVTAGTPAYTAEELGATVNEAGDVLSVPNVAEPVADAEVVPLDDGVVIGLVKGIEFLEWDRDAVNLALGSLAIDALDPGVDDLSEALSRLTPEDAGKLDAELKREAEKAAASSTATGEGATDAHA